MIAGKYANNGGCAGALGDGYTVVVYPEDPNFYFNPKLVVGGYRGGVSQAPREINGWSEEHELSWADGDGMNTCNYSIQPFAARFSLEVR